MLSLHNSISIRAGIQYSQPHNNQYVASINYHYYSLTLYEVLVQLSTTTTDHYHISHHEVYVIIFSCTVM